ncbi:MAG: ComEC family competence protein [Chitinophagales bacterium]|nr:ComEC family competence protein [Chitinophagales bacterium]
MPVATVYFWKKAPFVRLLIALMAGIILQWHWQVNPSTWWIVFISGILVSSSFFFLSFFNRYQLGFINGVSAFSVFLALGALLTWHEDIRHEPQWLGGHYHPGDPVMVTLDEPLVEKTKSLKANASVAYLLHNDSLRLAKGKIIIYFKKDSSLRQLSYGSHILFKKPLQEIKNSGNPGGFDYKRYSLFQGITHQVYLEEDEFEILGSKKEKWLPAFIFRARDWVINILRTNIKENKELGLAEALLIGYKDDLDQSLVQSYTNTGVVHVIAISGLHLGLIYWLLVQLLKPLQKRKKIQWLRPLLIITGLWLFSLLAGAQPSVLRSALMFTCIVLGEGYTKRTSIFNTLSLSAFILLCINPYWLWDVGFQLSYAAVLSIIIFMRPIYNWFYFKNKAVDFLWKLNAVTLAAQILTVPISIYHFHQFPNYFLLTNFVAVPLSSLILIGEIVLCIISFIPAVALFVGKILHWLIWAMNSYIERVEAIRFSLWDGLQISIPQAVLLIATVAAISYWLLEQSGKALRWGLLSLLGFLALRSWSFIVSEQQQKIIVYNVPQKQAIDFISGRKYLFYGDSSLLADDFARNFHLKPSRILYRINPAGNIAAFIKKEQLFHYQSKKILLLDNSITYDPVEEKQPVDLLVISKNPKLYINRLLSSFVIRQVVIDGSNSSWKATLWKKDCDALGIPCHDVTTEGAFVMNLR